MSKFDAIIKRIEEQVPGQPAPSTPPTNSAQQNYDPKIVQELIAARNEQQVKVALQKMLALQAAQQKPGQPVQPPVPGQAQPAV